MATEEQKKLTEQEEKDTARFKEINAKKVEDRTTDEVTELGELKQRHSERVQKRMDTLTWKAKSAEEREEAERKKREEVEAENVRLKAEKKEPAPQVKQETIEIGGKKYHTDAALVSQISAGDITQAEAEAYAKKRDKEEIKSELREENIKEEKKKEGEKVRTEAVKEVLAKYPHFDEKHKDFNPEDPKYKRFIYYYGRGYGLHPRGILSAVEDMERDFNIKNTHIDRSVDLGAGKPNVPDRGGKGKAEEVTLNEAEEEAGVAQWTRGDTTNPATGRAYTKQEAIAKTLEAKKRRLGKE